LGDGISLISGTTILTVLLRRFLSMGCINMKKKKIQKINLDDESPLSDSPFGNLNQVTGIEPDETSPIPNVESPEKVAPPPFSIQKSKKGNWPLSVEKRSGGKKVTLLKNIQGDGKELLSLLKKKCACGGDYKEGQLELQGDQTSKVSDFLDAL
jgi:translation initiation factor 1 (eIF-1/SUI1)